MKKDTPTPKSHNITPRRAAIEKLQETLLQYTPTKHPLNLATKPVPRVRVQDEIQHYKMPLTHVEPPPRLTKKLLQPTRTSMSSDVTRDEISDHLQNQLKSQHYLLKSNTKRANQRHQRRSYICK